MRLAEPLSTQAPQPHPTPLPTCRANPVWLDPFCRNLELAAQAEHEDDLPENLSEIADLWSSPTRTHVSQARAGGRVDFQEGPGRGRLGLCQHWPRSCSLADGPHPVRVHTHATSDPANILCPQGTFGREPAAVKPDDDRYLRAAIQEYDNIAKLGQIIREGPIKVSPPCRPSSPAPPPGPWLSLGLLQKIEGGKFSPPPGSPRPALHWDRIPEEKGAWALGLTRGCCSLRCPEDQGTTESCRQVLLLVLSTRVRGLCL